MYQPKSFILEDTALIERLITENSFATLVSNGENGLEASHLPFEFDAETQTLLSHLARANEQWHSFDGREAMAIFSGPHAYISPSWYETELAVPTWNYVVVHVYGVPQIIEDDGQVEALLTRLIDKYESGRTPRWRLEAPADWQKNMRRAIVGFEMKVTRLEAKAKLSQNRPPTDIEGVIKGLERENQSELAQWMHLLNPTLSS
ncbi:protease synthase and sporulation protein PAI 2 [Abditibacteriota bacterium]|nr:protease synthase and sporulation protein PAI 2 [Abditibacteriota bacterium]